MTEAYQKIVPHLWFDTEAKEAAQFYCSVFPESRVTNLTVLHHDPPLCDTDVVSFTLWNHDFIAISAGPLFKFNPSVSFIVNFDPSRMKDAQGALDVAWAKLAAGGTVRMPLGPYPFSKRYGWVQDRYGLSWQLILSNPAGEPRPEIVPALMFTGKNCGQAEAAIRFYGSVFKNARQGNLVRHPKGMEPEREGTVMFADFMLENQWFAAMDSAQEHDFTFNGAVSFMVNCVTQEEINDYWGRLSSVPEAEQCGWLKDRYGLSWQITPTRLMEMISQGSPDQVRRVTQTFLPMKKLILADLERAYAGR